MNKLQYERVADIAFKLNSAFPPDVQSTIFEEGLRELHSRSVPHRKILLVGGAGYIGSVVTSYLLQCGYYVRTLDCFLYENHSCVLPYLSHSNYEFLYGDFRNIDDISNALSGISDVIILGGLVGDPITKKYPQQSEHINVKGITNLIGLLSKYNLNKVIFISTCSNYGLIKEDVLADENWELKPLSSYAKAKVEMEQLLLAQKEHVDYCATILRFATAFGMSSRMRFDLTVNEFVRELYLGKELVIYDHQTWRPYCHVLDFALALRLVLEAPRDSVCFQVFNAGSDKNNYTKEMILQEIKRFIPSSRINYQEHGSDPRNYRVNFQKIKQNLHFEAQYSVADGIKEILTAFEKKLFSDVEVRKSFHGNYELIEIS